MPASGAIKLADANVWLAVVFSDHLHHPQAKTWFEVQGDLSMARRDLATVDDGQTLFQELRAFRLRELVHLRTVFLNNPSSNRLLG